MLVMAASELEPDLSSCDFMAAETRTFTALAQMAKLRLREAANVTDSVARGHCPVFWMSHLAFASLSPRLGGCRVPHLLCGLRFPICEMQGLVLCPSIPASTEGFCPYVTTGWRIEGEWQDGGLGSRDPMEASPQEGGTPAAFAFLFLPRE